MFNKLLTDFGVWYAQRKVAQRLRVYNNGFNWAFAELQAGTKTPRDVEAHYDNPFDSTPFDKGAREATNLLCRTGAVIDNRI